MLNIDRLVTSYPDWRVDFTATLARGEITALIGPSGAGKSTLLGMIAGFVPVESGTLTFDGQDLMPLGPAERPVTTLFQDHNLFLHLSVFDNIAIGLHPGLRLNAAQRNQVNEAAERVGLGAMLMRLPDQLSGGQQQRVGLARALVRGKPLLLLDEPFSALDPALRREMLAEVARLACEQGITVLMVSHNPEDAQLIADQVLFIDEGCIALQGKPEILQSSDHPGLLRYLGRPQGA
ncbi:thiamine ABC transporter ATP-binding protein [Aeromonas taiwanensis]|uniref:Thiamine ABC transporter ATP-binding protein n=1 Tax=Aeromonas taiwanensis TaxID=633417 RepID=A0A5F0K2Y5_9GAMM|nr:MULTISPECIES: thiamine ABC transporter ATP-binding protein [Aeromonas]MBP4040054.1 thiamine ABC transporter ATP-binding protein [Aeromonas sp. SrichE-2G]TFF70412.1 thiamine ABC transporter ATP-binding protein [Aeromonas taiwanensis]TFF71105.1 thiamine ABC transporter ATP-binding protein [Aeromonas taiwanensis]TFF73421.1 thiamine ABC transporter ATP-binding protein [Aeromonas taiwanensis]